MKFCFVILLCDHLPLTLYPQGRQTRSLHEHIHDTYDNFTACQSVYRLCKPHFILDTSSALINQVKNKKSIPKSLQALRT